MRGNRPPRRYDGKVAVVTGASSGIGRRLALDLAGRGAAVVGLARRNELLGELERHLQAASAPSSTRVCDVTQGAAFEAALKDVEAGFGRVDILVNNAGIEALTPAEERSIEPYRRIFEVNFFAVVTGTLAVMPGMTERGSGIVVNVSSDSARAAEPGHGAYAASKAAVAVFSESVAHEVAGSGVHVHVLYPGWVPTAMGMSGTSDGGRLPPRVVRRTDAQVSNLVLEQMGGERVEINASRVPQLASIGRMVAPVTYQQVMRRRQRH